MLEIKWTTFYGKSIEVSKLSHQHLSNIIHFFDVVCGKDPNPHIITELINRFGGIKLPYHPLVSSVDEIKYLKSKGYTTGEMDADIVFEGKWIGKIKYN
jgi:hypothetical protein